MPVSQPVQIFFVTQTNVTNPPLHSGPYWTFQGTTGDCAPGKFVTDQASSLLTTTIQISTVNAAGSDSAHLMGATVGSVMVFTSTTGATASFIINTMTPQIEDGLCLFILVVTPRGDITWNGDYSVSFIPAV